MRDLIAKRIAPPDRQYIAIIIYTLGTEAMVVNTESSTFGSRAIGTQRDRYSNFGARDDRDFGDGPEERWRA